MPNVKMTPANASRLRLEYRARWAVQEAIRKGTLTRQPCEVCGATKVDAHHEDHRQPLRVRWLCRRHHMRHDNRAKLREASKRP